MCTRPTTRGTGDPSEPQQQQAQQKQQRRWQRQQPIPLDATVLHPMSLVVCVLLPSYSSHSPRWRATRPRGVRTFKYTLLNVCGSGWLHTRQTHFRVHPQSDVRYPHPRSQRPWSLLAVPVWPLVSISIDCGHFGTQVSFCFASGPTAPPRPIWAPSHPGQTRKTPRPSISVQGPPTSITSDAFSCPHIILTIFPESCVRYDLVPSSTATHQPSSNLFTIPSSHTFALSAPPPLVPVYRGLHNRHSRRKEHFHKQKEKRARVD